MTRAKLMRGVSAEAALLLVGIPVLLWTLIPIYHMFLFAISPKDAAFSGQLWPAHPTVRNFEIVFGQKHHFLYHFWLQMWNSLAISCATAVLTLMIASAAAFAISRLRMKGGRLVMNWRCSPISSPPPSSRCRCTRPWACTACSTTTGR